MTIIASITSIFKSNPFNGNKSKLNSFEVSILSENNNFNKIIVSNTNNLNNSVNYKINK
ncbi:hypothetical protein DICPUDRAFT_158321 [Dictyostelium purpureum]|uniref:Uncharacterized protein n=1 Tax=Dictyostelium purpureum TaxID=5786 RepID=F1A1B5_DICPU|nr:uncharacterized protein DICPUDRAFT_158321 [Dictyostelium purpureum]EGC30011.1 hypothetical protein DICPUDRAFT_158321 [Dictyostelium purpureum]|eukprot:XP_003293457.1 hypothetical protein DICPUDRAFT_158321 [Dictyostelium purpureum]